MKLLQRDKIVGEFCFAVTAISLGFTTLKFAGWLNDLAGGHHGTGVALGFFAVLFTLWVLAYWIRECDKGK